MIRRWLRLEARSLLFLLIACAGVGQAQTSAGTNSGARADTETIVVDVNTPTTPFPHYWERMFGSGRAILTLRESYRNDLRNVKRITGFGYVRFHDILDDSVGVYDEDARGNPVYNFSYVDEIYDGLLANGVRPFVELSFMPRKLASNPSALHAFWYKQNVSPPKDWDRWERLVEEFARHLVAHYGLNEVSEWYFEVWNEPNIDFWVGEPKFETYMQLYASAASALKRVSPRLRVGGPATAQAAWVDRFIAYCVEHHVPVDFVSTHVYGNDTALNVFGTNEKVSRTKMVCSAVKKVHDQVGVSARPNLPIFWTEYNASYMNEPDVTDAPFMGPWLADTIRQCNDMVEALSYWTFSDVFDEQGVVKQPFYGGFGLIAAGGIPKPAFNAFALLHRLGERRLPVASENALATRRADGSLAIAVWNLFLPEEAGTLKEVRLKLRGIASQRRAVIYRIDSQHGSLLRTYESMDRPIYPTRQQIQELRKAAELPPPETRSLTKDQITLTLLPHGLALIEIR